MFKNNYEITISDLDKDYVVNNKNILKILLNTFEEHTKSLNAGFDYIMKKGYTIVLLFWKLQVIKRPKYKDNLEIRTWIKNTDKKYFSRDFEIYIDNNLSVIATSKWMILDIKTFKPVFNQELILKQKPIDKNVFNIKINRLKEYDNYSKEINYYIRKSDIDINNHVHNLNYLDMVMEIINDNSYSNIEIEYLKEIKYTDKIKVMSEIIDNKCYIKIYNETRNITSALIELY